VALLAFVIWACSNPLSDISKEELTAKLEGTIVPKNAV
jgi:hypothetical protein